MRFEKPVADPDQRPLRVDAARNRRAILAAAERLFRDHGPDVPLAQVAAAAGIGRATLYRNFPGRADLTRALIDRNMQEFRALAARQTGQPEDLERLIDAKIACHLRSCAALEMVHQTAAAHDYAAEQAEIAAILLSAARPGMAAGLWRTDLSVETFRILQLAMAGVLGAPGTPAERRARGSAFRQMALDGIRARPA